MSDLFDNRILRSATWTLFINRNGERRNKTFEEGREGLTKAIKAAEVVAAKLQALPKAPQQNEEEKPKPLFKAYSQQWLAERYEQILRLHLWPDPVFHKSLDAIGRKEIKIYLKAIARKLSPATVEAVHGVISGVFNEALDDELVAATRQSGCLNPSCRQKTAGT